MANKYKLIKEYPGSPKLGSIKEESLGYDQINYPEFWEKVVEKDYEVLQYRAIYSKNIFGYGDPFVLTPSIPWEHKNLEIYQIKRLSDSEIFTIGDSCNPLFCNNPGKIDKFEFIQNDKLRIQGKNDKCRCWYLSLSTIEKSKTPLFTTEDGVDICEGDHVCLVKPTNYICDITNWRKYHGNFGVPLIEDKAFSSRVNAEKYIEDNRVQFSRKQLLDFGVYARGFVGELSTEDCFIGWIKSPLGPKK